MTAVTTADAAPRAARNAYVQGLRTPGGVAGLALVGAVVLAGLLAPVLTSYGPTYQTPDSLLGPSGNHWLGTDDIGRDVFSRVLYGIRTDIVLVLASVPIAAAAGCALALLATASRWADVAVQRLFDTVMAFPALVMGLTVTAVVGPGKAAIVTVIALVETPAFGRVLRGSILAHRDREYAVAARVGGARPARVLVRHILPNAADPVVVQLAVSMSLALVIDGALGFLGIGVRPPEPSLGGVIADASHYLEQQPAFAAGPLAVVTALVLGLNLVAEALNKGARR